MNNVIEINNLNVSFEYKKDFWAPKTTRQVLHDVSFDIKEGEILGLVGESGSGKSTIAKSILGLIPYTGTIKMAEGAKTQMIFQDPASALNPGKKIGWLLEEALYLSGVSDKDIRHTEALKMLEKVGLDAELYSRKPRELSGGQKQRVSIGQALITGPKVLLADEPVSALDVTIQAQILKLLKDIHGEMNLSLLFISHDLRVVYNFCDRILILKDGRIVEQGDPKEIYINPQHEYTKMLLDSL